MDFWNEKNVDPGTIVANIKADGTFRMPSIISFDVGISEYKYALTCLSDGATIRYSSKPNLANALNEGKFMPVNKLVSKREVSDQVENRLGLPVVAISNCWY